MPSKRKNNTPKKAAEGSSANGTAARPDVGVASGINVGSGNSIGQVPTSVRDMATQAEIARHQQQIAAHRKRQIDPTNYTRTPKSGMLVVVVAAIFALLGSVTTLLHYSLPTPGGPTAITSPGVSRADAAAYHPSAAVFVSSSNNTPFYKLFSEANAVDIMKYLSVDIGYRIVGTKEHVQAENWLENILRRYQGFHETGTAIQPGKTQVEVWKQIGDGAHRFDFMGDVVWKRYYSMSNLVVRISDGTEDSKANSLLLNAHLDSTLPSPGGADDGIGVSILLETLRILTLPGTGRKLYNSVVLLFNDGEESLQDASHLYITQHNETKSAIKAVVNLEACGTSGPELLFQATSQEMIEAYAQVPHPYGTVLANDVFSTGLILSDTDFRQFVQYGDQLTGLDMALVGNSYLYHTRNDVPKYLEPGATQHFGENMLAIIQHLCLDENSRDLLRHIEKGQTRHSLPIYFSIAGKLFVLISNRAFKSIVMALSALINFQLSSIIRAEKGVGALGLTVLSVIAVVFTLVGAVIGSNIVALIMTRVLGSGMSWYRHEWFAILLYGPPALASMLTIQYLTSLLVKPYQRPYLERASLSALSLFFNLSLVAMNSFGIGSAYLMALASFTYILATTVNDFILIGFSPIEEKLVAPDNRVSRYTYLILLVIPAVIGTEGMVSFLDLFVPLTGRMGEVSPADNIIASIVAVLAFLSFPMAIPFSHRYTASNVKKTIVGLVGVTLVVMAVFANPTWKPFDADHPKRLFVHQVENITSGEWFMNLGAADPAPGFQQLANDVQKQLGMPGELAQLMEMNQYNPDFDILYPVSAFLTPYKFQLAAPGNGFTTKYASPAMVDQHFTIKAKDEMIDFERGTRKLKLEMSHPGVIWGVIGFDADILEWNLPSAPPQGHQRHHLKSVSRYGIDTWSVEMTIKLDETALHAAKQRIGLGSKLKHALTGAAATKDEGELVVVHAANATYSPAKDPSRLWIDTSGLVADEMYPQHNNIHTADRPAMKTFIQMDEYMQQHHPEVDVMMLTVVGAVFQA